MAHHGSHSRYKLFPTIGHDLWLYLSLLKRLATLFRPFVGEQIVSMSNSQLTRMGVFVIIWGIRTNLKKCVIGWENLRKFMLPVFASSLWKMIKFYVWSWTLDFAWIFDLPQGYTSGKWIANICPRCTTSVHDVNTFIITITNDPAGLIS